MVHEEYFRDFHPHPLNLSRQNNVNDLTQQLFRHNADQKMMGFIRKFGTFAFLLILTFHSALAGNDHEHLQYLPRLVDIEAAYDGKLGELPALDLFSNPAHLNDKFGHLIPPEDLKDMVKDVNLTKLCENISSRIPGTTPQGILESMFEMREMGGDPRRSYLASTTIRDELFRKDPEKIVPAIEHYLKTAKFDEAGRSLFSVPEYLADRKILGTLERMYRAKGMNSEYYYSIPRSNVPKNKFDESLSNARSLMGNRNNPPLIYGVDISGSIYESMDKDSFAKESTEKIKDRIISAFKSSPQFSGTVRIHAFERSNTGKFYDAIWGALRECATRKCLPATLRIGHINMLDQESIDRFQKIHQRSMSRYPKYQGMKIRFEANIESNIRIHQAEIKDLVKTIEKIHRAGMTVVLGSDGYGILGESSRFAETLERLRDAGMKRSSLRALIDDSLIPVRGSDDILKNNEKLARVRDELRERVFGVKKSSLLDYCNLNFLNRMKNIFH